MWVAQRYDMHQYQSEILRHLDYPDHTLILAPRGIGKTTVLVNRFFGESNSAMFFIHGLVAKDYVRMARDRARDWHVQHMYSMTNADRIHGKRYETIYVDELLWHKDGNQDRVEEFMATILPCTDRVVAVSTPNGMLDATFPNTVNIQEVLDGRSFVPVRRRRDYLPEELFEI